MKIVDRGLNNRLDIDSTAKIDESVSIYFTGNDNSLTIGKNSILSGVDFHFQGSRHTAVIGSRVEMYRGEMAFENDDCFFQVGDASQIHRGFQIAVAEPRRKVLIGAGCLFSWSVRMRTTDSHSIWDLKTNERINRGRDIILGDNVWVGEAVQILKGSHIQHDSVVGAGSVVTGKTFPPNVVIAGNPAKVVKSGIYWKILREDT